MEKRMERSLIYNGTITAEQFLFYEIRIASKYYLDGTSVVDAIEEIKKNNLFQYPTERLVARMVRSCYKRLDALDDDRLRQELSSAPAEIAKQINLYAMMRYNRIVWDFMVGVIGEKFRSQDFEFSRKDLNVFFSHLQEQNDDIAGWSESTVNTSEGDPGQRRCGQRETCLPARLGPAPRSAPVSAPAGPPGLGPCYLRH